MAQPAEPIERRLGHRFRDARLLERALTHRSFGARHNERLEFLGDGVLGCVIAEALHARFPDSPEGTLTRLRAGLVREESLAAAARAAGLGEQLRLGDSERGAAGGEGVRSSILADALEALFGAVFLDGGYAAARGAILAVLGDELERLDPDAQIKDAKTRLQELLQAERRPLPVYRVLAVHGAAHQRAFEVECEVPDLALRATGSGTSRQRAEQQAAAALLGRLAP